ncbi:amidohydrolase family protein [Virgibacillus sp. C22-A2]|uniref:Amidohydrolase family protein n=1 Tax=Virgibacillus tibetensis TaxID=3042313 RepID=A0ABU6KDS4_9BACI|nr:amidohydrolase family protein [Virgibacillus sp. C22-A2]
MGINLGEIKTIDVHCHPFIANEKPYREEEFLRVLSLSVIPDMFKAGNMNRNGVYPGMNMYMQITIRKLAKYFSCEPVLEEVVKKRNELAKDFPLYTQELFDDVRLEGLLVDFGYPKPHISHQEFRKNTGFESLEIYRIEPVMDKLRNEHSNFSDFIDNYRLDLRSALEANHVVGLKSIIAYRSGLDIGAKDEKKAKQDYAQFVKNERAVAKSLRDYCMHIAMEECTHTDKVMHIHTGVGDGEVVLPKSSPSLLIDMLREKNYENTKVHLVHGGYPWMDEAGFIASILPNVYLDISLQNPFAGHGVKRIISQVFEFAPFNKVMYGSDSFTIPEMNWLGVKLFKECFEQVLDEWVELDYMDKDMAYLIGEMVLYRNFEAVYGKSGS